MVDLGFVEKSDGRSLSPLFFPSKVGGKPAWLDCKELPTAENLTCGLCGKQMVLLLQVYAPDETRDECFHRSIFVFCCKSGTCYEKNGHPNKSLQVFRAQLKRDNGFYSRDAISEGISKDELRKKEDFLYDSYLVNLCGICGCHGTKLCSTCKNARYCSREHQALDWKEQHKFHCSETLEKKKASSCSLNFLLPEFELITEAEPGSSPQDISPTENEQIKAFEKFLESRSSELSCQNMSEEEIQKFIGVHNDGNADKYFQKFKERISLEPEQVLRYHKNGEPLWVSKDDIPKESDIPHCPCGAKRQFEFQILPQLLYHLKLDILEEKSVDWGTLAVYTCSENCDEGPRYHPEFVWKQDFSNQDLHGT